MKPPAIDADSLRLGDRVPTLERTLSLTRMVAYGAATWDWHRLHYDPAYAAARDLSGPIVDGQMMGALLAEALIDWLGPRALIRKLGFRLRAMVNAGETVRCDGEITSIADDTDSRVLMITQRIRVGDRVVVDGARAEVVIPR